MAHPTEQAPLLEEQPHRQPHREHSLWNTTRICILCYTGALLFDSTQILRTMPRTTLFESIICQNYYASTNTLGATLSKIPEHMCKANPIQAELVTTQTWLKVGESICALLVALPFGNIANTKGRSFVLTLAILGQILADAWIVAVCFLNRTLPLSLVYMSPLLRSMGGGEMVMSAVIYALVVDVVSEKNRAQAFFNIAVMTLIAELVTPAVGSILVDWRGVYTPLLCAFPLQVANMGIFGLIPDTRPPAKVVNEIIWDRLGGGDSTESSDETGQNKGFANWSKAIWLVTVCYISTMLARETIDLLVQYVSKRFEWSLAKANYLISVKALVSMALYLLLLPLLSRALAKQCSMSPPRVDLWIARGSSLFGVVGPILLGVASGPVLLIVSLVLFTLSLAYPVSIQSYGTSLLQPVGVAPFYSALAVIRLAATLLTSPLLALAFKFGLKAGGAASGLVFDVAGGLFLVAAIGSSLLP
ncbi:major facilitator superfamily domain-containing protein [Aspergillus bertholletiae]|uniref:Major facilitator superfamily domain-containing protein n=1 Tax=Aspergillus bertholletiae TaxID=1226010 RepID=A0A5N7BF64_9EURO|nr:major facilitator superfamily domain-containing protein [Aspergillus bertholletiae]